ncbi:DNA starvation/stationary phase protection protein [uncultured Winogradskyella sp.]|uniref:Dps family protein n=1 Tax=uncultured Winogradskyella sp. TaxID=395353 RepID=UPI002638C5DD|nr:DNA starvation/stationary phase protection protein [uncultured Winogradskyella sp.]
MNTKELKKNIKTKKLGFTLEEGSEIVTGLKHMLANYQMFYHKLRNFHWNIEGPDFFELHEEFEKEYKTVAESIDIIAERMRIFNIKPMLSLKDISNIATIKDIEKPLTATAMVSEVLKDYEILHDNLLNVLNISLNIGDNVTEQMMTDFMRRIEKRNWMFTSWCK